MFQTFSNSDVFWNKNPYWCYTAWKYRNLGIDWFQVLWDRLYQLKSFVYYSYWQNNICEKKQIFVTIFRWFNVGDFNFWQQLYLRSAVWQYLHLSINHSIHSHVYSHLYCQCVYYCYNAKKYQQTAVCLRLI